MSNSILFSKIKFKPASQCSAENANYSCYSCAPPTRPKRAHITTREDVLDTTHDTHAQESHGDGHGDGRTTHINTHDLAHGSDERLFPQRTHRTHAPVITRERIETAHTLTNRQHGFKRQRRRKSSTRGRGPNRGEQHEIECKWRNAGLQRNASLVEHLDGLDAHQIGQLARIEVVLVRHVRERLLAAAHRLELGDAHA